MGGKESIKVHMEVCLKQENTFLTVFFTFDASLNQINMFTCSLMKCCLLYAYHKPTKLIISSNTTSLMEAPKQRRDIYLLVNCSNLTTLHKHGGGNQHVKMRSDFCLHVKSVMESILIEIDSFASLRPLTPHLKVCRAV